MWDNRAATSAAVAQFGAKGGKPPYASVRIGAGTEIAIAIEIVGSAHVHDTVRRWDRDRKGGRGWRRKGRDGKRAREEQLFQTSYCLFFPW